MYWLVLGLLFLVTDPASATRYWVSTTGSDANSCAAVSGDSDPGVYKLTPASGVACLATAGDILTIRAGSYTGANAKITMAVSGAAGNPIIIEGDPSSATGCALAHTCGTILTPTSINSIISGSHVVIRKIDFNGVNAKNLYILQVSEPATDVLVEDVEVRDTQITVGSSTAASCLSATPLSSFVTYRRVHAHHCGNTVAVKGHGGYLSGDDITIEYSWFHHHANMGVQMFNSTAVSNGLADRSIIRNSLFEDNGRSGIVISGRDAIIDNNVVRRNATNGIDLFYNALRSKVINNVFYNNATNTIGLGGTNVAVGSHGTATDSIVQNNVIFGTGGGVFIFSGFGTTNVTISYNACASATSCGTTGKVTIAALTDIFVSTSDFRLKAGSAAINAGLAISGFPYNGSAPDIGAYESIPNPACSITTNKITCIFPMNLNVPIQNLSTTGVTVGCTGSACPGSLTVSAVSRVTATDTHVEIVVAGFAGNACAAANQNLSLNYDSATGSWSDSASVGGTTNQTIFSFTGLAVTNQCTGSGPTGYPAGYQLYYKLDENTGTNANDESANNLDGTLTNSPAWGAGKTGYGVVTTLGTTQYVAIPYGNAVNPSTQSMTIAFGVNVPAGQESATRGEFGTSVGTNQRVAIIGQGGTWRLSIQSSGASSGASSLAVTSGWNHLCLVLDSGTDTATLYLNGVAGTGSASKAYTSYTLASNFKLGLYDINTAPGGTYDDPIIYTSVQSCADIYTAFQAAATPAAGTLTQSAVQPEGVFYFNGLPWDLGRLQPTNDVVANGGIALVFQVTCENITDCDPTAFKLVYSKNEPASVAASSGRLKQVPNVATSDGISMWGATSENGLNTGPTSTRLVGSCAVTTGSTQVTADHIPSVDLPQNGCVMLRYLIRVGNIPGGYLELRLLTEGGLPLNGGYADARINVVNHRGSAF